MSRNEVPGNSWRGKAAEVKRDGFDRTGFNEEDPNLITDLGLQSMAL